MKLATFILLFLFSVAVGAQNIRLIVPFSPGGSADQMARILQKSLSQDLQRPVIVEHRPGASGDIGTAVVANAGPQDLLLLINGPSIFMSGLVKDKLTYNESNLVPLLHLGSVPFVVVVSKKSGIKTFKDLQNLDSTQIITYGSSGHATATHLSVASLQGHLNKNFMHIPYKGSGQAIQDLISGNIDMMFTHLTAVSQFIQNDQLTALAIDSERRFSQLTKVPTFRELGVNFIGGHGLLVLFSNVSTQTQLQKQIQQSMPRIAESTIYQEMGFEQHKNPILNNEFFNSEKQKYQQILRSINLQ